MLFTKKEDAKKFIDTVRAEQKRHADLEKQLEATRPAWNKLQQEAERLAVLNDAAAGTYTREIHSPFRDARAEDLQRELDSVCAQRDALTAGIFKELLELKNRIFHRLNMVAGSFGAWAWIVVDTSVDGGSRKQLSEDLRQELLSARVKAEAMTDPAALVEFITGWIERFETMPDVRVPLFRLDQSIQLALEVAA